PRQATLVLEEPADAPRHQRHRRATDRGDAANALDQPITVEQRPRHQIVRGRWYFSCRSPRTPRGIRSTTATMIEPKSSWWRYGKRAQTSSCETNSTTAPSTGPHTVPLPPNSTMTIIVMVVASGNTPIGST